MYVAVIDILFVVYLWLGLKPVYNEEILEN